MTLFFASDKAALEIAYDSLITNLSKLTYIPQFISDNYLVDRLSDLKTTRLKVAASAASEINSIDRPILTHYQTLYRSKLSNLDNRLTSLVLEKPWYVAVPILILPLFIATVSRNRRRRSYGLFLYFTAGLVSLTLEMMSFYVYQSSAGSLYSELAALIGVFMFGLSAGTYVTYKTAAKTCRSKRAGNVAGGDAGLCGDISESAILHAAALSPAISADSGARHGQSLCGGHAALLRVCSQSQSWRRLCVRIGRIIYRAILPTIVLLPTIGLSWLLVSVVSLLMIAGDWLSADIAAGMMK